MSTVFWSMYAFTVHGPYDDFPSKSGVYVFDKGSSADKKAYYVGESGDLADRLDNHEKWPAAARLGATHIHIRLVPEGEAARKGMEKELIDEYDPPLNR